MGNQLAVNNYDRLKEALKSPAVKEQFERAQGARAQQFIASILSVVSTDNGLRECDPASIITAAATAAVLDLPIQKSLGFAWIIGYDRVAQFQIGYKGIIQLAQRTGQYTDINAGPVYEGEIVKVHRITGKVEISGEPVSKEVIGYFAFFRLSNGFEKSIYWPKDKLLEHVKRYSKSYKSNKSVWHKDGGFDPMATKTVLNALLSKYGPMSVQMQHAAGLDVAKEPAADVIDSSFIEEPDSDMVSSTDPLQGELFDDETSGG